MKRVFVDAGIEHIRIIIENQDAADNLGTDDQIIVLKNNDHIRILLENAGLIDLLTSKNNGSAHPSIPVFLTGKLAEITQKVIGHGIVFMPAAVLWSAARSILNKSPEKNSGSTGIIDLSASGYMSICVDGKGDLDQDHLQVNPRCGAGTGVNLSRILQKLDIKRENVDHILAKYLGETGKQERLQIPIRTDRCGVFSSSATISDKNQGIPLDYALGITLKSEVMKPCEKMLSGVRRVYLTGGVFRWRFVRECAEDLLRSKGVQEVIYDEEQSIAISGMRHLVEKVGENNFRQQGATRLRKPDSLLTMPAFKEMKNKFETAGVYKRMPDPGKEFNLSDLRADVPVVMGLDIGSTMAKIVICHARSKKLLYKGSYTNHGDTIETVKYIFQQIIAAGITRLNIQNIGITGSGRYQVQKTLQAIYPHLDDRITVMVENYAHVWGSIDFAKQHIKDLKAKNIKNINEDFCLLIDIGGEDTKISSVSLRKGELFDNAMNIKCSAGTGSLMDTLGAMFKIDEISAAYAMAFNAPKAYGINATCAVFLMENARKMQAEGYNKDEILASCCHAIVENMARSLWDQIEFPENTIVLLHGQTMLSDPLPLAVAYRLQEYTGSTTYCLVPELPGHRACFGLVSNPGVSTESDTEKYCDLNALIERKFDKRITICRGVACGDKNSRCARTKLCSGQDSDKISLTLGGCTAINEFLAKSARGEKLTVPDSYREIWKFVDGRFPRSEADNRLVIPRSFAISEKAGFFADIFTYFGIPVHVDNVRESDVIEGQPLFSMDTCAPNIGAAGQFRRLAREAHKMILVPQIDFLPIEGDSLGRTCTTNQGGVVVASQFAKLAYPDARIRIFDISLEKFDPIAITDQVYAEFKDILQEYGISASRNEIIESVKNAIESYKNLQNDVAELACDFIETAINGKHNISIVSAREYILNPGIYDSHAGKLLRDKGVVAIPCYVLDVEPDKKFDFIYWKNPHDLLTRASAIANKRLHKILIHPRLKKLIQSIETGSAGILMSEITVSTFRCGPDSITLPILNEVTKNVPSLLIQSDAMIAELAHLENRVNTHLNQLKKSLHQELRGHQKAEFSIELLDGFNMNGHDRNKCVLYFPTMGDNRSVSAVFRASGFTTIDNFDDDTFDLEEKVKIGRKYVGDSVCVPLTAVFSDMLLAVDDFKKRKAAHDPLVMGKDRILLFMQSGDGPCRQGQYIDICKLNLYKRFNALDIKTPEPGHTDYPVHILTNMTTSLNNKSDFMSELEDWAAAQVYHAVVIKDVLHAIYLEGSAKCSDEKGYRDFLGAYKELKATVMSKLENDLKPGESVQKLVNLVDKRLTRLSGVVKYFGYGFHNNNGLRKILREFVRNSMPRNGSMNTNGNGKLKIHVDGEVYLRVAQLDEIQKFMIDTLGFNAFRLHYTPVWGYFEYILESRIVLAEQEMEKYQTILSNGDGRHVKRMTRRLLKKEKEKAGQAIKTTAMLRNILARPLYEASDIKTPNSVKHDLQLAKEIIPTLKPEGELISYVGAAISEINNGTDLILNIAPEGCMVASMGEMLSPAVMQTAKNKTSRIQYLSSTEGELNEELITLSLLKILGPIKYYAQPA